MARAALALLYRLESRCQLAVDRCIGRRERQYGQRSQFEARQADAIARRDTLRTQLQSSASALSLQASGPLRKTGAFPRRRGSVASMASVGTEVQRVRAEGAEYRGAEGRTTASLWYTAMHSRRGGRKPTRRSNTGANLSGLSRETLRLAVGDLAKSREQNEARLYCVRAMSH